MTTFDAGKMFAFDLETTGTNPHECRIVTSALVRIDGGAPQAKELLADPGVEIPEAAAAVHGITTEHARAHGRPHDEVLAETIAEIRRAWRDGLTLVAYNAAYDLTVLRSREPSFTVDGLVFDPWSSTGTAIGTARASARWATCASTITCGWTMRTRRPPMRWRPRAWHG